MNTQSATGWQDELLDRELVLTRVVAASRELLFSIWTDPEHLPHWFGPDGFTIDSHQIDIKVGGRWVFDMVAPDGTRYSNRMVFTRIEAPRLIEVDYSSDVDDDPDLFRMRVEFLSQANGKTIVILRQLHASPSRREIVINFGAVELGYQTTDKMAAYAAARKGYTQTA